MPPVVVDPETWIVRLPPLLRSAELALKTLRVLVGSPGLTVPPAATTGPAVPVPPRTPPELTVTVLPVCVPSTSRVPALTVVAVV